MYNPAATNWFRNVWRLIKVSVEENHIQRHLSHILCHQSILETLNVKETTEELIPDPFV